MFGDSEDFQIFMNTNEKVLTNNLIKEFLDDIEHEEIGILQLDIPLLESTYKMLLEGKITSELLPQIFNKIINEMASVILSIHSLKKKWEVRRK